MKTMINEALPGRRLHRTVFIVFCLSLFLNGFGQKNAPKHIQEKYTSFSGDLSLNSRLYQYFEANIKWENYDTLCLSTALFVKFTAGNKKISAIRFSDDVHPFLNNIIEKALLATAEFWQGKSKEDYLLPFYASFEDHCHPKTSIGNLLLMLQRLSDQERVYTLPGAEDYKPLNCTLLNTYFIKSHWE